MGGRIVGLEGKPLKAELHHWWPKGLSKLWADVDGTVGRLGWDGKLVRSKPSNFGGVTNAHHVILEGPWAGTVEPIFDRVDSDFPYLVNHLQSLSPKPRWFKRSLASRLKATPLNVDQRRLLGHGVASLIVRSPGYRDLQKRSIQAGQRRFGFPENYKFDNNLISLTIDQHFPFLSATLEKGGKAVLLHSHQDEFITGEGYLHNLHGSMHQGEYRCLVPLTPNLSVLLFRDARYRIEPNCFSLLLSKEEVEIANSIAQIYTKDCVLFRSQQPRIEEYFASRSFMELSEHSHDLIDRICEAVRHHRGG